MRPISPREASTMGVVKSSPGLAARELAALRMRARRQAPKERRTQAWVAIEWPEKNLNLKAQKPAIWSKNLLPKQLRTAFRCFGGDNPPKVAKGRVILGWTSALGVGPPYAVRKD